MTAFFLAHLDHHHRGDIVKGSGTDMGQIQVHSGKPAYDDDEEGDYGAWC